MYFLCNGELCHVFLDCVPIGLTYDKKDWCYVKSVFMELHRSSFFKGYKKMLWWSDTGPNHFRVSNTVFFMRQFQELTGG